MGYLTAVALAPVLLFALHAGAWVDRSGQRRRTMIACDLGRAALLVSVPIAYALRRAHVPAALRGRIRCGGPLGAVQRRGRVALPDDRLAGALRRGELPAERQPRLLLRRRPDGGGISRPGGHGAGGARRRRALVPLLRGAARPHPIPRSRPPTPSRAASRSDSGGSPDRRSSARRCSRPRRSTSSTSSSGPCSCSTRREPSGVSAGTLGLVLGAGAVGGLVGSVAATPVSRRIGIGPTLVVGCVVFAAPFLLVPLAAGP